MSDHRTATALRTGLREYRRMPVLWILLVGLPAYVLVGFGALIPDTTVLIDVPGGGRQAASMVDVYVTVFTPLVAGLVAGVAGLFLMRSTGDADGRLVVAGYRPREVILARVGLLVVVGAAVTAVSVAVATLAVVSPATLPGFVAATLLSALIWGLVGVLAGLVLGRLAGVYLILFGTTVDVFLVQNPLVTDRAWFAPLLPGYAPVRGAIDAGFSAGVDPGPYGVGLAVLGVLGALAVGAFSRSTRPA